MSLPATTILERVVARYDETGVPVTPAGTAERADASVAEVRSLFDRFADCELLVRVDEGYRPTVTARELVALDVDGCVVVDASGG